jgi:hypothetical protein
MISGNHRATPQVGQHLLRAPYGVVCSLRMTVNPFTDVWLNHHINPSFSRQDTHVLAYHSSH